jgi:hypothetical protein
MRSAHSSRAACASPLSRRARRSADASDVARRWMHRERREIGGCLEDSRPPKADPSRDAIVRDHRAGRSVETALRLDIAGERTLLHVHDLHGGPAGLPPPTCPHERGDHRREDQPRRHPRQRTEEDARRDGNQDRTIAPQRPTRGTARSSVRRRSLGLQRRSSSPRPRASRPVRAVRTRAPGAPRSVSPPAPPRRRDHRGDARGCSRTRPAPRAGRCEATTSSHSRSALAGAQGGGQRASSLARDRVGRARGDLVEREDHRRELARRSVADQGCALVEHGVRISPIA